LAIEAAVAVSIDVWAPTPTGTRRHLDRIECTSVGAVGHAIGVCVDIEGTAPADTGHSLVRIRGTGILTCRIVDLSNAAATHPCDPLVGVIRARIFTVGRAVIVRIGVSNAAPAPARGRLAGIQSTAVLAVRD